MMVADPGKTSTISTDGSDWSGINLYQSSGKSEPSLSPNPSIPGNLPSPPASGSLVFNALGSNPPDKITLAPPQRPNNVNAPNTSPPSSIGSGPRSRSSAGTLADKNGQKQRQMEERMTHYYLFLKAFLQGREIYNMDVARSEKARRKLFSLSRVQFFELLMDVHDELRRRKAAAAANRPGGRQDVPPKLAPEPNFHQRRNQARGSLAMLPPQRFTELIMDACCDHERRHPHLVGGDMSRHGSPAPSVRSRFGPNPGPGPGSGPNGPGGLPPMRGSPGPGGRGFPPGPPNQRFPPRQGSLSGTAPPAGLGINGESIPENAPYQKSFQSNTIVPNKSTLIEDDDSGSFEEEEDFKPSGAFALDKTLSNGANTSPTSDPSADKDKKRLLEAETQVTTLQSKVEELESLLDGKEKEITALQDSEDGLTNVLETEKKQWKDLEYRLMNKLSDAESLNKSLQTELDNARRQQDTMEREMEEQMKMQQELEQQRQEQTRQVNGAMGPDSGEWKSRFETLDKEHQALKLDLELQQEITERVREQALNSLDEMKVLASGGSWEREEALTRDVHRLEEEVKLWKHRYAKSKTQQRQLRSSSLGMPGHIQDATVSVKEQQLTHPEGLVKDVHITKFQMAIDELLRIARADDPALVLEQMKAVVVAVRLINMDIEGALGNGKEHGLPRNRAKTRVSATANNLITASKNFAHSNGLSPVSLLDAAASHLAAAVIDLIRNVKIRETPENELVEEDELDNLYPMQSPGYFSVAQSQSRFSGNESIYSAMSSPSMNSRSQTYSRITSARITQTGHQSFANGLKPVSGTVRGPDRELEGLRIYLEDQTEGLVQSIQALVASIRADDNMFAVKTHINSISTVVNNVVSCTEDAIAQPNANPALRQRTASVVELLSDCRTKLVNAGNATDQSNDSDRTREVVSSLPPIAFQIARETKELVQRVDQLEIESREDDDFR